jgi:hypothetical protein
VNNEIMVKNMRSGTDKFNIEPESIICDICKHIIVRRYTCEAFPMGIPEEILKGRNNHSKTLPEQENDIVFGFKNLIMPLI